MALETATEIREAVGELRNARQHEAGRLHRIRKHLKDNVTGRAAGVYVPVRATREFRLLVEQARFNVLPLVVDAVAQNLYVDGYRPSGPDGRVATNDNADIWNDVWQPNRMDARQAGLYRAAISYGSSYALVLPGDPVPVITPYSPLKMTALYVDAINGEWPEVALGPGRWIDRDGRRTEVVELYDDAQVMTIEVPDGGRLGIVGEPQAHNLGVTPVVRFLDQYELEGSTGKIEPLIPIQQQMNQTTFSLLMAQQYASFRQRYVTGMEITTDKNGNPIQPWNSAVDTVWSSDSPDTRFGEFGQTDLGGYLASRDKALLHIASVAQIPPHNLLIGPGVSNISAEALAALEAGHRMDIAEHQTSFGESIEQMLRLAALAADDRQAFEDTSAQVVWRDTTPRSMAQIADALGKLASQLDIPPRALWERIPGVTDQDISRWEAMAAEGGLLADLEAIVNGGGASAELNGSTPDPTIPA